MSSSTPTVIQLSLTYTKVDHKAVLSSDGHIHYANNSLDSITEFCNEVTDYKTSGQVADRIKFSLNGKEIGEYSDFKEKVQDYHKKEKLKALHCLLSGSPLPTIVKKEKKEKKESSESTQDSVKQILKQFKKLSLEDKGRCMKLLMSQFVEQVNEESNDVDNTIDSDSI
ncbi:predicted protein [Naegleria gruberi]|uniref:Predicted protein n=1 Tax=Naegleria gruberi TaxID=5762 RepID=D2VWX1_NAEGR|nr:uncharacterized protein NAEGRDRAFT_73534 [Naegleria gruberi]EFC38764.1 predicted protein [Naegleria gruberi]|eukprot:XP_002671508.1 predicted protein [Naegleria gruberi strain NEG-M]